MMKTIAPLFLTLFFLINQFAAGQTAPTPPPNRLPSNSTTLFSIPKVSSLGTKSLPIPPKSDSPTDNPAGSPSPELPTTPQLPTSPYPTPTINPPPAKSLPIPPKSDLLTDNRGGSPSPELPTTPQLPTSIINRPSKTIPSGETALPSNPPANPTVWLDPNNNKALPVEAECDIARLLVLENTPVVTADGSTPFAVVAKVYESLLNLFATDEPSQAIMYTDNVKPFFKQKIDKNGNYSYTTNPGSENILLGYSHCLSATKFRDVLCKDQNTLFTLDANVDSNQQTYFWVHFTTVFLTVEDNSENGMTHYQWVNHTGIGDYYDFYLTKDHPNSLSTYFENGNNLCFRSFTGNIWVGSKDDSKPTHDWTVTGNKFQGLLTSSDGGPFVPEPTDSSHPPQSEPEPPTPEKNKHSGSSWEDFEKNGAGSSWEAYLQKSSTEANSSPSDQNQGSVVPKSGATPNPSPSLDNNSSQKNPPTSSDNSSEENSPPLDKKTKEKIELAVQLYKEGKSLEQIASATGFTEEQLNHIFSYLSQ